MGFSSQSLVEALAQDTFDLLTPASYMDYGFFFAKNDEHRGALFGVYQMLYKYNDCDAVDFHEQFLADNLNEWVASFHKQVENPETGELDWVMECKDGTLRIGTYFERLLKHGGIKNPYISDM